VSAPADRAPDFVEPVVGYRAWHVDDDGMLRPWTFTALPWHRGVNDAVCARDARHRPPVADCMCGLYALTDPSDRRLHLQHDQAVGAIAAWGDLEVHRTCFRAQHACVVALALPDRASDEQRERLERAAARYAIELVPPPLLSAAARRHGAPLPDDLWAPAWPGPRRRPTSPLCVPAVDPGEFGAPARGIALDAHLWVETALGGVVVGVTGQLARRLGEAPPGVALPEPGAALAAGDRAATLTTAAGTFAVWAPVGGTVTAVNPRVVADPGLLVVDPEGAGWLLRLAPADWAREGGAVSWGPAAARHYAACLARDAVHGDAFGDVRLERLRAVPRVRDAGEVLEHLRAQRARPRFADRAAVERELGGRLCDALAGDADLRARLGRLGLVVGFSLRDPAASLVLDLRDGDARLAVDGEAADLVLSCRADDAYAWFTGTLDAASALRGGVLRCSAGRPAALRLLAVLKHLRIAGWVPAPAWSASS
jgi:glycine cleavage system H lipoate-binding protein